ncbi:hypothetical protein CK203_063182 [Vitis vinifera]|uniref:Uncharacterized protein n=1 Tax=Vitis vinifera TaxID=29760 RepID=A0A438G4H1_VITVI|nr:hypothetical protein CK203_063182 [Vitis vinifera]
MRIRGLQAGPKAPQAHQTAAASSPSPQRVGSSAKAIALLCPGDERADFEAIFGERNKVLWYGSLVSKGRKRSEKGESSRGSDERFYAEGRDDNFKEDVVHPLPSKR